MNSIETVDRQLQTYSDEECRYIITANPDNEKLIASLGLNEGEISDDEYYSIYRTWTANNRFVPPHLRNDDMEYYKFISVKLNQSILYFTLPNECIDIRDALRVIGELKVLPDALDKSGLQPKAYSDIGALTNEIYDLSLSNSSAWLGYLKDKYKNKNEAFYTIDSIDKYVVTLIKQLVSTLSNEDHVSYKQEMRYLNSTFEGDLLFIDPLQKLLSDSICGGGNIISAIELLYNLINISPWAWSNNPDTEFRIGSSAGSMIIFNSILIRLGYKVIPTYAIDFAAYALDTVGFTKYLLYVISKVEGQEIHHELPEELFQIIS